MKSVRRGLAKLSRVAVSMAGLLTLLCVMSPTLAEARTIYVKADAAGAATGVSWPDAYTSLQDALAASLVGDEVWVAAGTYKPDEGAGILRGDRTVSFPLKGGVALYGGFAGSETDISQRDWSTNKTILSGDLNGDDLPDFLQVEDNSEHIVTGDHLSLSPKSRLDGFTLQGGNASTSVITYGGGVYFANADIALCNCTFQNNLAKNGGGGADFTSSLVTMTNCSFFSNRAYGYGGAVALHSSDLAATHCTFANNEGGAALDSTWWGSNKITLTDCNVNNNSGGILLSGDLTIADSRIEGNTYYGVHVAGMLTMDNTIVQHNAGSGIHIDGSLDLTNSTIVNNTSSGDIAGGLALQARQSSKFNITNTIFWGNTKGGLPDQLGFYFYSSGQNLTISYSNIEGGRANITHNGYDPFVYTDNIDSDPLLTPDGHLLPGSPCIDAADPASAATGDFDGETRPSGARSDIGADEFIDTDKDGLADTWELRWFGGLSVTGGSDPDGDGIDNEGEYRFGTNPTSPDSDGDGSADGVEVDSGTDPNNPLIYPGRIFVRAGATGAATGSSWADAYTNLQDGLSAAWPGCEIWVAAGTYRPDQGRGVTPGDRDATFSLKPDVSLHGGFAGTETTLGEQDAARNPTILSGDLGDNDGPDFANYAENSRHVVTYPYLFKPMPAAPLTILDGFTISHGYADSSSGAGIVLNGIYPLVRNCTISDNRSLGSGGGIYSASLWLMLEGCRVSGNSANEGGGVYSRGKMATLVNSIISGNAAAQGGDGLFITDYARILHSTVFDNPSSGPAITIQPSSYNDFTVTMEDSIIWGNSGTQIKVSNNSYCEYYNYGHCMPGYEVIGHSYLNIAHCDLMGGVTGITTNAAGQVVSNSMISSAPHLTTDGHLTAGSPCIDAGNPASPLTSDIDGEARPVGSGVDIGADEFRDSDQDGLPDFWEIARGLDPNDNSTTNPANGPAGDPDGNGITNLQEYVYSAGQLLDQDGDGYSLATDDCDDSNPAIHPYVIENCTDGIDNNCNGDIDGQTECNPMACLFDAQCGTGEYCQRPAATCNGVGSCQNLPGGTFVCPTVVDPVCGCDGKDYPNSCEAQRQGVSVAAHGQCAATSYKWPYYFPSVKDNAGIGWENYLSVQAKAPVPMEVKIRVYDMTGKLAGSFIYSDTDLTAKAKAVAPNARVAQRPSLIAGGAIEGSIIVETSVPAIATTNCIASYYKGFSIYEAAKVRPIHYFPKAYDGPDFYQVYMVVQNIFPEPRKVTAVLSGKTTTSPGHGANQTTTIPPFGTWKFRPSDIAGGINFDGSVSVFSDLTTPRDALGPPIPAMCRYEAGTDALAIYESAARQPRLFFPVLKDGKFGTTLDYQNYISVVNMNPQPANVSVILYNKSGAEEGRLIDTIPSSGKKTWRPSTIKGSAAVPADFDGLVVIISDQTLFGQTNTIYPGANKYGADAFDLFESAMRNKTLFFPKAYDNLLGAGTGATHLTDNFVYVSNPDGNTKSLKIEQFNNNGTANGAATVELSPYATHVYRPKNLVTDNSGVFRGSVKVTEQSGLSITGAIKYEIHKTTDPASGIEAMTIYRSMGQ